MPSRSSFTRRRAAPGRWGPGKFGDTRWILLLLLVLALAALVGVFATGQLLAASRASPTAKTVQGTAPARVEAAAPTPGAQATVQRATPISSSPASAESPEAMTPTPEPTGSGSPFVQETSRFAVLLLGYGGGSHQGAYLTDSMMVAIVDPAARTLALLSLPRDSWVPLVFSPRSVVYNKVNTAYALARDDSQFSDRLERYQGPQGAGTFSTDTVSQLLGIPIAYYVGLDFEGFRQAIDAVGGVDVVVPASFSAHYPRNDDPSVDAGWMMVRFAEGPEHMGGERAIQFARARETTDNIAEGTDFARSRRQRLVIQAFKDRLLQPEGLLHLPQLVGIATQHVDTDYALPDVPKLGQLALSWRSVTIYQTALTTENYLESATGPEGAYIVVPNSPDHSWAQIRAFARQLWNGPAAGTAMADTTIVVENDSGAAGLGGRVSEALLKLGYRVADPTSGSSRARTQLVDRSDGKATALVGRLERDLGIPDLDVVQPSADEPSPTATGNQLVLRLGADQTSLAIVVPNDAEAPSSTVGVVKFGIWPYVPPAPTPTPTPIRRPTPTPTPTSLDPGQAAVPSLVGLSEEEAQRAIVGAGLMTTYVNYQTAADVADRRYFLSIAPGHVLSQTPQPGTIVPRGTKVLIAVRKE